jgi:hypothetical protein
MNYLKRFCSFVALPQSTSSRAVKELFILLIRRQARLSNKKKSKKTLQVRFHNKGPLTVVNVEISGIFGNILAYGKCRLATLNKYYNVLYSEIDNIHYHGNLLHEITVDNGGIQNPNFWITPDSSYENKTRMFFYQF